LLYLYLVYIILVWKKTFDMKTKSHIVTHIAGNLEVFYILL